MIDILNRHLKGGGAPRPHGAVLPVPLTAIYLHSSTRRPSANIMSSKLLLSALVLVLATASFGAPPDRDPKTFFFDGLTKGFTISRVTTDDNQVQQSSNGYQVRFVPLISLLAGMFPSILSKLGQFTGVNKMTVATTNNRRFPVAEKVAENTITTPPLEDNSNNSNSIDESSEEEDENDDYIEKELIECDGNHMGLWPDRTDPQRYYKCEIDPRTSPTTSCIKEMINNNSGKEMHQLERIEVPGVKPCYLLSMLKCANGFKYQHATRICVPDIVYGHRH